MLLAIDMALALHRTVNYIIEILSRLVVRRDDERRVRVFHVLVGDGRQAFLAGRDFVHPALLVKPCEGAVHVAASQLLNNRLQLRVPLPHDLVQMRGTNPRFLELVIRPAGIDSFMLAHIAN